MFRAENFSELKIFQQSQKNFSRAKKISAELNFFQQSKNFQSQKLLRVKKNSNSQFINGAKCCFPMLNFEKKNAVRSSMHRLECIPMKHNLQIKLENKFCIF